MPSSLKDPTVPRAPRDWVDEVVVDRLVSGVDPGPRWPTRAERQAAAARLLNTGLTPYAVSVHLRVSAETAAALIAESAGGEPCRERRRLSPAS